MYKGKRIALSVTSCKRLNFLERVLKAFKVFCKDLDVIDDIIFFDDSSTEEEKRIMENIIHELFPKQKKTITHFYPNSFTDGFRHARILNSWREKLTDLDIDYTFHLEDDYLFVNHFSISECVDLLEEYPEYGYINLNQSWKNFPPEYKPKEIGNYWEWIYRHDLEINECLFMDDAAAVQQPQINVWLMYINWPSFSLRPGLLHVRKLLYVGEFSTSHDPQKTSAELEFAIKWSKKFKSLCNKNFNVINLGFNVDDSNSSYTANNSYR